MVFKKQVRKLLTGFAIQQEYLCISLEEMKDSMRIFLTVKVQPHCQEVTRSHVFLGYKPLVIALVYHQGSPEGVYLETHEDVCLHFGNENFDADRKSIARLALHKMNKKMAGQNVIFIFECIRGEHFFISRFHQWVNSVWENFRKRDQVNISLPGNLYEQVRIAYSIPRIISIVTVCDGSLVNMFPTDLHGSAGDKFYLCSLRIGGKANAQVEQFKRVVISEVDVTWYRESYAQGKNHMSDLRSKENFLTHQQVSAYFGFPLPAGVVRYRELVWRDSLDAGIHRVHIFEVVSFHTVSVSATTLAHVHKYYAQWRDDQGLKTSYFLR